MFPPEKKKATPSRRTELLRGTTLIRNRKIRCLICTITGATATAQVNGFTFTAAL